jgi:hypothetical protein
MVVAVYGQEARREPDIEIFYLAFDGEIEYRYVLDKKACNCFFQINSKGNKSVSITQVSCDKLNRIYSFKESYAKCFN